ncbi:AbrB/MazE/SpoVT family DNA-binding domain-containing protein [Dyadobacter frigoris]|uniref:AbrB/MazE/SpoVT family DNA-binding domain-containing protein n=1 Tax=Dyadobacter frigoris TaxID=2576211 RepID=A0A4U6CTN0_9BACT|nr:AbrB/MazE/SpoVT family DNA-binding domain-containing protein [Dyadobacter frigoris]TKT86947.1 AbrB/MazE/SpoVT family DNA-binding domain-containing protein [Dyadobacter frigoris]GLU56546.1 hypothetical protein Dfri01_60070 [Dyadobacter frigoris]
MKTKIIKMGEDYGVIIPSHILNQLKLSADSEVKLSVKNGVIFINRDVRGGWANEAKKMAEAGDDQLLLGDFTSAFDNNEWTWEGIK